MTVAGTVGSLGIVDPIHLGNPTDNTGLSSSTVNGYNFYTPKPFADILSSQYADLVRSGGAGGITGTQTLSSTDRRGLFLICGGATSSYTWQPCYFRNNSGLLGP